MMDSGFTAEVEDWLDDISRGERDWVKALGEFYGPFVRALQAAPPKMSAFRAEAQAGTVSAPAGKGSRRKGRGGRKSSAQADPSVLCPMCNSPMVRRKGSRGEFWGCSRYPACKGTRNISDEVKR